MRRNLFKHILWILILAECFPLLAIAGSQQKEQRYKIAVCDWMILKRQKIGSFQLVHELNGDGVELDMGGLGKREMFDNKLREPHFQQLFRETAQKYQLEISSIAMSGFYGQSFLERDNYKDLVQDCLYAMKVMNVKVAFLPLGGIKAGWEKIPALRTEVVKRLKEVGDMAASEGVVIGIETQLDAKGDVKLLKEINYNRGADGHGLKLPTVNITIQNSIFSEALDTYNHAFGATIGGHNSMFCRNLFASNISRNSSVGMDGDFNFVNNVVFNWWNRSVDGGDHNSFYNMINNYFKPGPITPIGKPISYRILKPEAGRDKNRPLSFGKAYVNGNIIHGNAKVTKDNWDGGVQLKEEVDAAKFLPLIKSDEAFKMPPVTVMDTKKAYTFVLDNVGANFPKRDAVDARVIKTVQTGKAIYAKDAPEFVSPYVKRRLPADSYKQGIITDIRQVGGLPEYKGEAVVDSDGDGMPDAWETANGLNPNDPADANMDCNGDGYTNIEKYINGIDTRKKVDWTDLKNNYDTLSKRRSLL
ncbi:TIM barrel protein [Bacteroides ovatus]|uniref:TIM barrel protein n=1 Tax=Bacteroides ovatus TaxID=28116 RepID=UPI00293E14F0|nr:TIM barrel protein [Bacteroides ovatus]